MDIKISGNRKCANNALPLGVHEPESKLSRNTKIEGQSKSTGLASLARYRGGKRMYHNEDSMKGWINSHLISDNALIPKSESTEQPNLFQ